MSKAVLISIRPKWCEKIINGDKTIEVRKTRPKIDTPFKCYIYCTIGGQDLNIPISQERIMRDYLETGSMKSLNCPLGNGKVIGEFTCDQIIDAWWDYVPDAITKEVAGGNLEALDGTGMTDEELFSYVGDSMRGHCYGWHISNLRIYDAPRELSEFERPYECNECDAKWATECNACHEEGKIKRAPQSWCYVEDVRDEHC